MCRYPFKITDSDEIPQACDTVNIHDDYEKNVTHAHNLFGSHLDVHLLDDASYFADSNQFKKTE